MISVEEAQALAIGAVRPSGRERVTLAAARGRVLAESVAARVDVPPHRNSAMDGWAVRAADTAQAPVVLRVVGESAAGRVAARALAPSEAMRISTGAVVPDGADAVVMVERSAPVTTDEGAPAVRIEVAARAGDHIREPGEDVRRGTAVLAPGQVLDAASIALLAAVRRAVVTVSRAPEVALISTGDELRDVDEELGPGAIAESNGLMLAALVEAAGGRPRVLPIARDDRAAIAAAFRDASSADLVVTTGGVSVGAHDHVKDVLADLGATLSAWRVDMKPGKPIALARLGETPIYGLPGNPVSAMVGFHLFVRPAIRAALGCATPFDLPLVAARLAGELETRSDRRQYLRARVTVDENGALVAAVVSRQGSHQLSGAVGANALVVLDAGAHRLAPGAEVRALLTGALSR
jgi:molybdopterin molybdotransferase